ncbi:hypothetical protein T4B_10736 [Trichinella pseudospiralis]|uniref:Uncharacterized protein n=1 Tax=Trichinella pseudospiralis TaxID=6337 RepID=A0A0V1IYZ3_TRIPS|nr:hypothetical protein T4B_10736 [Trichinella pseudospiralis]
MTEWIWTERRMNRISQLYSIQLHRNFELLSFLSEYLKFRNDTITLENNYLAGVSIAEKTAKIAEITNTMSNKADCPVYSHKFIDTVTQDITNGDEAEIQQDTAVTTVGGNAQTFYKVPPHFTGDEGLKIWLMQLVDYFKGNAILEVKRYGYTKLLLSDKVYVMVVAAGWDTRVVTRH